MAFVSLFHPWPCSSNLTTTPSHLLYLPYFMYVVWYFHPKHFGARYRANFYPSKCGAYSMTVDQINSGSIFTRISTYRLGPIGSVWSYNGRIHSVPSTFLRGALSLKCTQFQINYRAMENITEPCKSTKTTITERNRMSLFDMRRSCTMLTWVILAPCLVASTLLNAITIYSK